MKKLFSVYLLLHISCILFSQEFKVPSIRVDNSYNNDPVEIQKISFDIKVIGTKVVTSVDMEVYNPNHRILEGELQFPLAPNQTVCGFSLDINGRLRESVAVEKDKGRTAFESIARRKVDPGLLEMTADNNFKLHIYPINARNKRRAVISYEQELTSSDNYTYKLPLTYNESVREVNIKIEAYGQSIAPVAKYSNNTSIEVTQKGDRYELSEKLNDKFPDEFTFQLIKPEEQQLFVERGKYDEHFKFYSISKPTYTQVEQKMPKSIAIYWDASLSMQQKDIDKEYNFLEQYLKSTDNIKIKLYTFGLNISKPVTFDIVNGNIAELKNALKNISYDGATRYDLPNLTDTDCEQVLFFSDGLASMGDKNTIPQFNVPVITINSKAVCNHFILQNIASASGGKYIDLTKHDTESAVKALKYKSFRFISAEYNKREIKDIYPSKPQEINIGEPFRITGILKGRNASIKLNFGVDNTIMYTETLKVNASESHKYNNFIERYWVNNQLNDLYRNFEKNKTKITELGKKYQMVTRTTSLIVLETIEDYVLYDIIPPEELQDNFYSLKKRLEDEKEKRREDNDDDDEGEEPIEISDKFKKHYELWKASADLDKFELLLDKQAKKRKKEEERKERQEDRREEREDRRKRRENKQYYGYSSGGGASSTYQQAGNVVNNSVARTITGHITDRNDMLGLPGVSIQIPGTTNGTMTDIDGYYSINVPAGYHELQYLFIAYNTITVPIKSSIINVQMGEEERYLSEVVIMGVGSSNNGSDYTYEPEPTASERIASGASARPSESTPSSEPINVIELTNWKADEPYSDTLTKATAENIYQLYLNLKTDYFGMPSFYADAAGILREKGLKNESYKVLSNIAELDFENPKLLRVLARKLSYWGYLPEAIDVYNEILILRPEEPQSYRDLALAYADDKQYQKAIDLFNTAVQKKYDERFTDISTIMLGEMGNIIATAKREGVRVKAKDIENSLLKNMDTDIRIVLNWDTDNTDMDLLVTDPDEIISYFGKRVEKSGGLMSVDFRGGYGPEEFIVRKAVKGTYKIDVKYFSTNEQKLTGPPNIFLEIYTNYGRPNMKKEIKHIRLDDSSLRKKISWSFNYK